MGGRVRGNDLIFNYPTCLGISFGQTFARIGNRRRRFHVGNMTAHERRVDDDADDDADDCYSFAARDREVAVCLIMVLLECGGVRVQVCIHTFSV